MFERRLKVLLWILATVALVLVGRLVHIQVINADVYRAAARDALRRPPIAVACTRGRILDRTGSTVLAEDRPCWDVCVPYRILAGDRADRAALAAELIAADGPRAGRPSESEIDALERRIDATWAAIAEATGTPLYEVADRRERIVLRVRRIRETLREKGGLDHAIAEEQRAHPVVRGLDHAAKIRAEVALADFPWVRITDSTQRWYCPDVSLAHVLGRLEDPGVDDVFTQPLSPDLRGVAGVERLAEDRLRGTRGRVYEDIEGFEVAPPVPARDGEDVRLTIDPALQRAVYDRLAVAVNDNTIRAGAAAVVLDVATREILALVSYPAFDPNPSPAERRLLHMDRQTLPMRFRAVSEPYPPGSTVKPVILAAALTQGVVAADTTVECVGRLLPENEHAFRCLGIHGPIAANAAIAHSCNVYFYTMGERLGATRERQWLEEFGFGRTTGTGLVEEQPGRLPTDRSVGAARNVAIGQGELEVTPLQAANMIATLAEGLWRPTTLLAGDAAQRPAHPLPVPPDVWRVVRESLYSVVNEPGGTAYGKMLPMPAGWVLIGKTGSATGWARELERLYVCEWPDGVQETYIATDGAELRRRLAGRPPFKIVRQESFRVWPATEQKESHAWFVGCIVPSRAAADWSRPLRPAVAISVVIEFAGHGGAVAAPAAGDIAHRVLETWPARGE